MSEPSEHQLADIASSLYKDEPTQNLYHYTSLDGVVGIHKQQALWATKVQYFSDSSELSHAFSLFRRRVDFLLGNNRAPQDLLSQLSFWLQSPQHTANAALFVVCFTERRDSLSQWRGYTPMGRGACIELRADQLIACTRAQGYDIARCVYQYNQKASLAEQAIDRFVSQAAKIGPSADRSSSSSYYPAFEALQQDLLRIAATFKHDTFEDEQEWRAVRRHDGSPAAPEIAYRVGRATLIPYIRFSLVHPDSGKFTLWNVWVGPTPHLELSVAALRSLLGDQIMCGRYPVMPTKAPYRET